MMRDCNGSGDSPWRFRTLIAAIAAITIVGFVFLNYRDPWPPIVPPPLEPEPSPAPKPGPYRLAPLPDEECRSGWR